MPQDIDTDSLDDRTYKIWTKTTRREFILSAFVATGLSMVFYPNAQGDLTNMLVLSAGMLTGSQLRRYDSVFDRLNCAGAAFTGGFFGQAAYQILKHYN
jgi:hypothetical protein